MVIFNSYAKLPEGTHDWGWLKHSKTGIHNAFEKQRPIRNHSLGSSPSIAPLHGAGMIQLLHSTYLDMIHMEVS